MKRFLVLLLMACVSGCAHCATNASWPAIKVGMSAREVKALLGKPDGMSLDCWSFPTTENADTVRSTFMLIWKKPSASPARHAKECHVWFEKVHPRSAHAGNPANNEGNWDHGWIVESVTLK